MQPMVVPAWWTPDDDEAVARYDEWDQTEWFPDDTYDMTALNEFCEAHQCKWTCRRCAYWDSPDGDGGQCHGPELECGETGRLSECEQFEPRRHNGSLDRPPAAADGGTVGGVVGCLDRRGP